MKETQNYYINKITSAKFRLYRYLLSINNLSDNDAELLYILSKDKEIQKILDNS